MCIVTTCTAVGLMLRRRLIDRADCLERLVAMLDYLSAQISYVRMPIGEIVLQMSAQSQFTRLTFLSECRQRLSQGVSFPQAWKSSVVQQRSLLSKEDFERLISLGDVLGTTDALEQQKTIEMYTHLFEKSYESARGECTSYSRMYLTIGVLAGVGFAILML